MLLHCAGGIVAMASTGHALNIEARKQPNISSNQISLYQKFHFPSWIQTVK